MQPTEYTAMPGPSIFTIAQPKTKIGVSCTALMSGRFPLLIYGLVTPIRRPSANTGRKMVAASVRPIDALP